MTFKHIPSNTTKYVEMSGIFGRFSGKNDLIYLRNKWQRELDNAWAALMNMTHYLEENDAYKQTVIRSNDIARYRGSVDDKKKEKDSLYKEVFKCIEKDQAYEERMWKIHQEMYKTSSHASQNVSRSFKNINVTKEEIKRYVTRYPTTQTSNDLQMIKDTEKRLKDSRADYRHNLALLRDYFEQFKLELGKLESKYKAYIDIKEEGTRQLEACSYKNTVFYRMSTMEFKQSMCLNTLQHRVNQVETTINHFKDAKVRVDAITSVEIEDFKKAASSEFVFDDEF